MNRRSISIALMAATVLALAGAGTVPAAATAAAPTAFGVDVGGAGLAPGVVPNLTRLDASWARVNDLLDGTPQDFARFLDAGVSLVITFTNRDPANVATTYGTPSEWPQAGFPFASEDAYRADVRAVLEPLVPYLDRGLHIWAQSENEVGDASVNPGTVYWRGTTDQYLAQLSALGDAAKAVDPRFQVVLAGIASSSLDIALDSGDPRHPWVTTHLQSLLSRGSYDAVDLHLYGCVEDIAAKAAWVTSQLPSDMAWISTENGGPDPRCPSTPHYWYEDQTAFELSQEEQVPDRLQACADAGGSVCLWFSLFDLRGEVDEFNHLGLLDPSVLPAREKPAYDAFRSFTGVRTVTFFASQAKVGTGARVRFTGALDAGSACAAGQTIEVQVASPGSHRYLTIGSVVTLADGSFRDRERVTATADYRAVVPAADPCMWAWSTTVRVRVV